jgi:hypothetical protein
LALNGSEHIMSIKYYSDIYIKNVKSCQTCLQTKTYQTVPILASYNLVSLSR